MSVIVRNRIALLTSTYFKATSKCWRPADWVLDYARTIETEDFHLEIQVLHRKKTNENSKVNIMLHNKQIS